MNRDTLIADEGMIYTDGNTYGSVIHLAEGINKEDFYQITVAEYEALHPTPEIDFWEDEDEDDEYDLY